jgi:hypothetical protein
MPFWRPYAVMLAMLGNLRGTRVSEKAGRGGAGAEAREKASQLSNAVPSRVDERVAVAVVERTPDTLTAGLPVVNRGG